MTWATWPRRVVVAADAAAQRDLRHRVEAALAGKVFDQRRTIESELAKLSCKQWKESIARCAGGEDRALVFLEQLDPGRDTRGVVSVTKSCAPEPVARSPGLDRGYDAEGNRLSL